MSSPSPLAARTLEDGAVLRVARPGDEAGILAATHALAAYEREPDAVRTTVGDLTAALFGDDPKVFAHVIERDGGIRAIAVWFLTFSTWTGRHGIWLEDLFVDETDRGRGYGTALLGSLAAVALERGYPRLEWTVLDWNAPAVGFYRSIGAEGMEEWTTQRMAGDALAALARR
ncbi:GNAT family N-acetyltransferase [Microbacterium sp. KSW-18]|uniref:GNAT family N-acetyltransferase n=1 Tax=Microbacterium aquilitoris TaxID=3067307 RepID=A0ABU3GKS8_9MICO|nr:GNAT family N-acetyltransferase [Microbacterium sp. KSW-18]MDT3330149.1 GNAT family N-acetyltransferase [Microbacterium sp. KSW-18]